MTESGINPKDVLGMKKPPLDLVPPAALIYLSKVMGLGAAKYGRYNWRSRKVRFCVYTAAVMRHILAAQDGEDVDPESGQPHVAHAMACVAILLDAAATGNLVDDRPTPGAAARLIAEMTEGDGPSKWLCPACGRAGTMYAPAGICRDCQTARERDPGAADPCGRPDCEEVVQGIPRDGNARHIIFADPPRWPGDPAPFDPLIVARHRQLDRDIAEARDRRDADVFQRVCGLRFFNGLGQPWEDA